MIKQVLEGDTPKAVYQQRALDRVHRFMMAGDSVRGFLVRGNRLVREMKANHALGSLETLILGQASLGALLMAANLKEEGRIRIQWECGGPVGGLSVEADSHGAVRGYLQHNPIPFSVADSGKIPDLFGPGFLTVTRLMKGMEQARTSTVALQYGEIAPDLTAYHLESEQIPTAMAVSVVFDASGQPEGAGALFLQALPGAPDEVLRGLERSLTALPSLGRYFADERSADSLILELFAPHAPRFLDSRRVEFFCPCDKALFQHYMQNLPAADRDEIRRNGPFPLVITCENCGSVYRYSKEEIQALKP